MPSVSPTKILHISEAVCAQPLGAGGGIAVAMLTRRNNADGRIMSRPKGVSYMGQGGVAVLDNEMTIAFGPGLTLPQFWGPDTKDICGSAH